jgi:hypothetical protein
LSFEVRRGTHPSGHAWIAAPASYRVSFWKKLSEGEPPGVPLWAEDGVEIVGAQDIVEVLTWIEEMRAGRVFTIDLEIDLTAKVGGRGMVRVYGVDPPQWNTSA